MPSASPSVDPTRRRAARLVLGVAVVGAAAAGAAVLLLGTGTITGAGTPDDAPAAFATQPDFRPGATVSCLEHQTEPPNGPYQGGPGAQTRSELTFLAYYTAGGRAPFCDGARATDVDRTWAQLYVQLTGNADNVSAILR